MIAQRFVSGRNFVACLAAAFMALTAPAAAGARGPSGPHLRVVGTTASALVYTDDRYALDWTGSEYRIRDTPAGRQFLFGTTCNEESLRAHLALFTCGSNPYVEVLDLATRASNRVAIPDGTVFGTVGRFWLRGVDCDLSASSCTVPYLNWHTGERRDVTGAPRRALGRDIDSADLRQGPLYPAYAPRFDQRVGSYRLHGISLHGRGVLVLDHGHKRTVLRGCSQICGHPQISRRMVTWSTTKAVHAIILRTGKRLDWSNFPGIPGYPLYISHTEREVEITSLRRGQTPRWLYYARRVP